MTGSTLKKFILTPVILSATVFGALTLPLALLGSKPVTIQFQEEPLFHGQLRDVAAPYLGLASVLSVGAGIASVAISGWSSAARKSSQVEAQLSGLEQHLKEKEELLETLKLSEARLEASGLKAFLEDEATTQRVEPKALPAHQNPEPAIEIKPLVITTQPIQAQPVALSPVTTQAAAAQFASAQAFLGYTQVNNSVKPVPQESPVSSIASSQVDELHAQLQNIMAQMASVQTVLSSRGASSESEPATPGSPRSLEVVKYQVVA